MKIDGTSLREDSGLADQQQEAALLINIWGKEVSVWRRNIFSLILMEL